jgi:hypothetical protein
MHRCPTYIPERRWRLGPARAVTRAARPCLVGVPDGYKMYYYVIPSKLEATHKALRAAESTRTDLATSADRICSIWNVQVGSFE